MLGKLIAVAACLLIAAPAMAQDAISHAPGLLPDKASPVTRVFYNGTLSWYWSPGGSRAPSADAATQTRRMEGPSPRLRCASTTSRRSPAASGQLPPSSRAQRRFRRSPSRRHSRDQRHSCHTLTGFNAVIAPGEFQVVSTFNLFEADNIFAGISSSRDRRRFRRADRIRAPTVCVRPAGTATDPRRRHYLSPRRK